jgi:hypothetical protein
MIPLLLLACAHSPELTELEQDNYALRNGFQEIRQDVRAASELSRMYHEALWDRAHGVDEETLRSRDAERLLAVRGYLEQKRVSSLPDHLHAATVLYYGTHTEDYRLAWELCDAASDAGFRPARALAAASWDRWKVSRGEPQDYGTQTREVDGALKLVDVSDELSDEERARWDTPPLAEAVAAVLAANGHAGIEPTLSNLAALDLLVDPGDPGRRKAAPPTLPRCADFEGLGGEGLGGEGLAGAYVEEGISLEGARLFTELEGDRPEGVGISAAPGQALVLRFEPPIVLYQFSAVGVAGYLSVTAYSGEDPVYPDSVLALEASSEGWAPGGRLFTTGTPRPVDRLELRSQDPADAWGLDNLCVGP